MYQFSQIILFHVLIYVRASRRVLYLTLVQLKNDNFMMVGHTRDTSEAEFQNFESRRLGF